jgi:hypothetical protein
MKGAPTIATILSAAVPLTAGMQATAVTHAGELISATIKNKEDINSMTVTTAGKQTIAGKKATT